MTTQTGQCDNGIKFHGNDGERAKAQMHRELGPDNFSDLYSLIRRRGGSVEAVGTTTDKHDALSELKRIYVDIREYKSIDHAIVSAMQGFWHNVDVEQRTIKTSTVGPMGWKENKVETLTYRVWLDYRKVG